MQHCGQGLHRQTSSRLRDFRSAGRAGGRTATPNRRFIIVWRCVGRRHDVGRVLAVAQDFSLDPSKPETLRLDAAKAAIRYERPALSPVEQQGESDFVPLPERLKAYLREDAIWRDDRQPREGRRSVMSPLAESFENPRTLRGRWTRDTHSPTGDIPTATKLHSRARCIKIDRSKITVVRQHRWRFGKLKI